MTDESPVVFAGFGAGAIAYVLARENDFAKRRVAIYDPQLESVPSQLLCSFLPAEDQLAQRHWNSWWVRDRESGNWLKKSSVMPYAQFELSELKQKALAKLKRTCDDLELNNTAVQDEEIERFAAEGRVIIDSRPSHETGILKQHFLGIEFESQTKTSPNCPILFDPIAIEDASNPVGFMYVIPTADNRVLIEATFYGSKVFAPSYYRNAIHSYRQRNFAQFDREVRQERGVLELSSVFPRASRAGLIQLGKRGGVFRPSTGYSFARSLLIARRSAYPEKWSQQLFWKLLCWMDEMMLHFIKKSPAKGARAFERLFTDIAGDQFASFLSPFPRFAAVRSVVWNMPKGPMIQFLLSEFLKRRSVRLCLGALFYCLIVALGQSVSIFGMPIHWPILFVLFALVGIPHGMADVFRLKRLFPGWASYAFSMLSYIALAALFAGWWWFHALSFWIFFFSLTVIHFLCLEWRTKNRYGVFAPDLVLASVFFPPFFFPDDFAAFMNAVGVTGAYFPRDDLFFGVSLLAACFFLLRLAFYSGRATHVVLWMVFLGLMAVGDLWSGFLFVFLLVHSLRHLDEFKESFGGAGARLGPTILLSFVALVPSLYFIQSGHEFTKWILLVTAALTLPHTVVERLEVLRKGARVSQSH